MVTNRKWCNKNVVGVSFFHTGSLYIEQEVGSEHRSEMRCLRNARCNLRFDVYTI